jgi:uncharacterized membrane protein YczE
MPLAATPDSPWPGRVLRLLVGLALVAGGVALMIVAEVGVAPYDVFNTGLAESLDIPVGAAAMLVPAAFIGLGLALGGRIGPGTVAALLLVGPALGGFLAVLPDHVEPMAARVPLFAVGMACIAAGITMVIIAECGAGPAEVLMLAVHHRGVDLAVARTGIELSSVAVGTALGGQVGIGTAAFALTIGPILRWSLQRVGYESRDPAEAALCVEPGV